MVLPSKHEYPQYYDVIEKPIDMATIKKKVEEDQVCTFHCTLRIVMSHFYVYRQSVADSIRSYTQRICVIFAAFKGEYKCMKLEEILEI